MTKSKAKKKQEICDALYEKIAWRVQERDKHIREIRALDAEILIFQRELLKEKFGLAVGMVAAFEKPGLACYPVKIVSTVSSSSEIQFLHGVTRTRTGKWSTRERCYLPKQLRPPTKEEEQRKEFLP